MRPSPFSSFSTSCRSSLLISGCGHRPDGLVDCLSRSRVRVSMGYKLLVDKTDRYLHVRVTGENIPENVRAYLGDVYQACADSGISSVLVEEDLRGRALDPVDVYRIIAGSSAQTAPIIQKIAY